MLDLGKVLWCHLVNMGVGGDTGKEVKEESQGDQIEGFEGVLHERGAKESF